MRHVFISTFAELSAVSDEKDLIIEFSNMTFSGKDWTLFACNAVTNAYRVTFTRCTLLGTTCTMNPLTRGELRIYDSSLLDVSLYVPCKVQLINSQIKNAVIFSAAGDAEVELILSHSSVFHADFRANLCRIMCYGYNCISTTNFLNKIGSIILTNNNDFVSCRFSEVQKVDGLRRYSSFHNCQSSVQHTALEPALNHAPQGNLIVYKKLGLDKIATLQISPAALRSSAGSSKMRASRAKVLAIEDSAGHPCGSGFSLHDPEFVYTVGKTVHARNFDKEWNQTCSAGIHFFLTKEEARDFHL